MEHQAHPRASLEAVGWVEKPGGNMPWIVIECPKCKKSVMGLFEDVKFNITCPCGETFFTKSAAE